MKQRKTNILLELIDDIIVEYPNTKEKNTNRHGNFYFLASFRSKNIFTNQAYHNVFTVICKKYYLVFCIYLFEI